jgi:hypothetical protein
MDLPPHPPYEPSWPGAGTQEETLGLPHVSAMFGWGSLYRFYILPHSRKRKPLSWVILTGAIMQGEGIRFMNTKSESLDSWILMQTTSLGSATCNIFSLRMQYSLWTIKLLQKHLQTASYVHSDQRDGCPCLTTLTVLLYINPYPANVENMVSS